MGFPRPQRMFVSPTIHPYLDFLRQQWKDGPEAYKPQALINLFESLIVTEWSGEREAELFALLPQLGEGDGRVATDDPRLKGEK